MDSIQIGLLVLSAVVAVLLALAQVRRPREKAAKFAAVLLFFFAVLAGLSGYFAYPELNVWYHRHRLEPALAKMPLVQALRRYDPGAYAELDGQIRLSFRGGESRRKILQAVRRRLDSLVRSRLPRASDAAAVAYVSAQNDALAQLGEQAPALCYQLLVPSAAGASEARWHLSAQTRQAGIAAAVEVIKASARRPQPVPSEAQVSSLLNAIYMGLARRYGRDLSMLRDPAAATVERAKVCTMTRQLYANILQLPPAERGRLLRYIFAQRP